MNNFFRIGKNVFIHPFTFIKRPELVSIGNHVAIDNGVTISTKINIGDYVHLAPYVCIIGGQKSEVIFEDLSFAAAGTKIVAGSEDYLQSIIGPTIDPKYRKIIYSTIKFEKFSGCGVNCSILPGVTLAEGSVLGANSLLTKNTQPWTIYAGSPAKPIKMRNKEIILKDYEEMIKNIKL